MAQDVEKKIPIFIKIGQTLVKQDLIASVSEQGNLYVKGRLTI